MESEKTESASAEDTPIDTLSHRQQEILKMIAEDLTSREIGDRLGVSTKTVQRDWNAAKGFLVAELK